MIDKERILKEINTSEGQEMMRKWIDEYLKKVNSKKIKIQEMLSNTDYINWLDRFTIEHSNFSDDDWLYFPDEISMEDAEQVDNLNLLYDGIERYASNNCIYPTKCDFGNIYKIKFGNTGFEIGILVGQGTLFFCNRVQVENQNDFIDFNDIIKNMQNDLDQVKVLKKN